MLLYLCICMYVHMGVCVCVRAQVCVGVCMCVFMDGFAYALWCVHMCVYAYAHSINMMPLAGCMSPSGDSRLSAFDYIQSSPKPL